MTTTRKRKKNYVNNADLLVELEKSEEQGAMTHKLSHMLQTLADRYGNQGKFVNYSYLEDMKAYAMFSICKTWNRFDPEKSNNPFAFFTQCIKNSFFQFLNKEKRQRMIRDELLVFSGLNPSNSYIADYEDEMHTNRDDMGDLDYMESTDTDTEKTSIDDDTKT